MIPNQWYAVLESKEVPLSNKPVGVKRFGEKLVFWRTNKGIHCIIDQCIHRGAQLSIGKIKKNYLQCPFHGFEYDEDGKVKMIPANGKNSPVPDYFRQKSYRVEEKGGLIFLWYGKGLIEEKDLPDLPMFDELEEYKYWSKKDLWNVDYSLVIENQLDVVHLPFVHKSTIGRGNRTLVNGPLVETNTDTGKESISVWVFNSVDDGSKKPLKPNELFDDGPPQVIFRFPNIWQNIISQNIRVFVAFVPIDDNNTLLYIRFYYKGLPILRSIIGKLGARGNLIITNQDKRVVKTQNPKKSYYKMEQKLIQGDIPIIEYRRLRNKLINLEEKEK